MSTRCISFIVVILLFLSGCTPAGNCGGAQNSGKTLRILFIGDSYTYVNDLPGTFRQLACSGGHNVVTGMAAESGWTLAQHAASSETLDTLDQQKWDIVVLQEQSELPAIKYDREASMYPTVRALAGQIRALGALPILFITWGYRDGLPSAGMRNYFDMQAQLDAGYMGIANELNILVAPVGDAWLKERSQPNPIDLWQEDGSHPNEKGTYLAACVFYATIFHQSPEGLSDRAGLSQDTALTLQTMATEAALKGQP